MMTRIRRFWGWLVEPTVPEARACQDCEPEFFIGIQGDKVFILIETPDGRTIFHGFLTVPQACTLSNDLFRLATKAALESEGLTLAGGA